MIPQNRTYLGSNWLNKLGRAVSYLKKYLYISEEEGLKFCFTLLFKKAETICRNVCPKQTFLPSTTLMCFYVCCVCIWGAGCECVGVCLPQCIAVSSPSFSPQEKRTAPLSAVPWCMCVAFSSPGIWGFLFAIPMLEKSLVTTMVWAVQQAKKKKIQLKGFFVFF